MVDDATRRQVFQQVQRCMESLVGGSGHLAAYTISLDSFEITGVEALESGLTAFDFVTQGARESEFTIGKEGAGPPKLELLQGRIVLDQGFGLTRDETGRVRLFPWTCVDLTS